MKRPPYGKTAKPGKYSPKRRLHSGARARTSGGRLMSGVKRDTHLRPSLRAAINAKCKSCIFDPLAMGNWRQQVTLCSVRLCPLWEVRPVSRAPIPDSVLSYYGVQPDDPCLGGRNEPQIDGHTCVRVESDSLSQGAVTASQSSSESIIDGCLK